MKNISTALIFMVLLVSCKGNTIFEEPIDLIPKDSMVLVLKDLYLASAAKGVKNKKQQKRVSYMPLVYHKHKIDSMRFSTSNFYYISKVDVYQPMINEVMSLLEKEKAGEEQGEVRRPPRHPPFGTVWSPGGVQSPRFPS